jgi:hydrogenase maturation protease
LLKPILVLCLGNDILTDDTFGVEVARRLMKTLPSPDTVTVEFAPVAGFNLLEMLRDRRKVLIVDTIQTYDHPPGTIHFFSSGHLTPSSHLVSSHQITLPTALALGTELGLEMPGIIDVLAVEAEDVTTLGITMTPAVETAVPEAVDRIHDWIRVQTTAMEIFEGAGTATRV